MSYDCFRVSFGTTMDGQLLPSVMLQDLAIEFQLFYALQGSLSQVSAGEGRWRLSSEGKIQPNVSL